MTVSLRRRLTLTVISIFLISWVLSALLTTVAARIVIEKEVDKLLSAMLEVTLKVGGAIQQGELESLKEKFSQRMVTLDGERNWGEGTPDNPLPVRFDENFNLGALGTPSINIWVGGIQLLIGPDTPRYAHPLKASVREGEDQVFNGQAWRIKYLYDETQEMWYAAGLPRAGVPFDAGSLLLQMLQPLALIIPVTVLALYFGIQRNLGSLRSLSRLIEERRSSRSLEPINAPETPEEMIPVVASLNHLLERLADTLENEQRFTANAAHELQTPLAAVMTEVQLCQRLLTDDDSRAMMERIYARVQRASHSVKQLLTLARLDPQDSLAKEPLSLSDLLETAVSELAHLLAERSLQLHFDVAESALVSGDRESLLILFRNLIGNAFRYCREGGQTSIRTDGCIVIIENDAEPVENADRLTDRFYRGENLPESGTGLGLSIAGRICELHNAELQLGYDRDSSRFVAKVSLQASE